MVPAPSQLTLVLALLWPVLCHESRRRAAIEQPACGRALLQLVDERVEFSVELGNVSAGSPPEHEPICLAQNITQSPKDPTFGTLNEISENTDAPELISRLTLLSYFLNVCAFGFGANRFLGRFRGRYGGRGARGWRSAAHGRARPAAHGGGVVV